MKLAERHIDEVDSEKQQYAAEVQRLRELVLSLEKRIRETEGIIEKLKYDAKMQLQSSRQKNRTSMLPCSGCMNWKPGSQCLAMKTVP